MKIVKFGRLKEQKYAMKESLRALKTNIQFCGDDIQTIVVTSALPNEGKSTVTMDLARSLTESGKRVLLIDTDMRKSVYVGRLRATASDGGEIYGLSHFLSGQKRLEDVLYGTEVPVKNQSIVKAFFHKADKIIDCIWCNFRIKLCFHYASIRHCKCNNWICHRFYLFFL